MASTKKSAYSILKRPLITEKAAVVNSYDNCVVFEVHTKANKIEIKKAVEELFDVKVSGVRTAHAIGKQKRVGTRVGRQRATKKAYVSLEQGSTIDFIEGL